MLVDSTAAITRSINHALVRHGLTERPEDELRRFIGPPLHGTFAELAGAERADGCVAAYRERYAVMAPRETVAFDGVAELLRELAAGRQLAVVTAKPVAYAEPLIAAVGLREHVHAVVGPRLDERAWDKADGVAAAIEALDAPPAALVGDRAFDVVAAHAHGLVAVGVTWGAGTADELREAGADVIVHRPAELRDALAAL